MLTPDELAEPTGQVCMRQILAAFAEGDAEDLRNVADDLHLYLAHGGLPPYGMSYQAAVDFARSARSFGRTVAAIFAEQAADDAEAASN